MAGIKPLGLQVSTIVEDKQIKGFRCQFGGDGTIKTGGGSVEDIQ